MLKDMVFSRWLAEGCEERSDTMKMVRRTLPDSGWGLVCCGFSGGWFGPGCSSLLLSTRRSDLPAGSWLPPPPSLPGLVARWTASCWLCCTAVYVMPPFPLFQPFLSLRCFNLSHLLSL